MQPVRNKNSVNVRPRPALRQTKPDDFLVYGHMRNAPLRAGHLAKRLHGIGVVLETFGHDGIGEVEGMHVLLAAFVWQPHFAQPD